MAINNSAFNLQNFKSNLTGGGARPNLFRVDLDFPSAVLTASGTNSNAANLQRLGYFMVKAAALPASQVGVIEVPFRGRTLKVAGDRTFEPWTITVVNDTNFSLRNVFETWVNSINQSVRNVGIQNPADYQKDMKVNQLNREGNAIKAYQFYGCFPTNVSAIDLAFDTNDTVEEFTVELQVQWWTPISATTDNNGGGRV
jgi:hypothetical protein